MRLILYQTKKGGIVPKLYGSDQKATNSIKALKGKLRPVKSVKLDATKRDLQRAERNQKASQRRRW